MKNQKEDSYVIITAIGFHDEIYELLLNMGFSRDRIIDSLSCYPSTVRPIYFEFPELIPKDGIFIDAGAMDGKDTMRYMQFAGDGAKAICFEPDKENYMKCKETFCNMDTDIKLIRAGLSDKDGYARFSANANGGSFIMDEEISSLNIHRREMKLGEIEINKLDSVISEGNRVGMIKMDIEGSEYAALCGAREVLIRDKPFLAISVYHKKLDLLYIMGYLHDLVPEYRFWIRQYDFLFTDTILYAAT